MTQHNQGYSEYCIGSIILAASYALEAKYTQHKVGPVAAIAFTGILFMMPGSNSHSDELQPNNVLGSVEINCTWLPENNCTSIALTDIGCGGLSGHNCTPVSLTIQSD